MYVKLPSGLFQGINLFRLINNLKIQLFFYLLTAIMKESTEPVFKTFLFSSFNIRISVCPKSPFNLK